MASSSISACKCSFFGIGKIECGESRGKEEFVLLSECNSDVSNHLRSCHLSRAKVTEYELILARAGIFNQPLERVSQMTICPKHRHNLGNYWRPLRTCQYPGHEGRKITLHCKNPINWQMAQEIQKMFVSPVQVGSRKSVLLALLPLRLLLLCGFSFWLLDHFTSK